MSHSSIDPIRLLFGLFAMIVVAGGFATDSAVAGDPSATSQTAQRPKVLLIGIDGLRADALRRAATPQLDSLIQSGVLREATRVTSDAVPQSDTVSGPGWTTFLTGTWADGHGVVDNSFKGRNPASGPHWFRHLKKARPELRTASIVNWTPLGEHVVTDADVGLVIAPPAKDKADPIAHYDHADRMTAATALTILTTDDVDAMMIYFGSTDGAGHAFGFHPTVREYVRQIEKTDQRIGDVLQAIRERPSFGNEDWLFIVGTDHGGEGTGHGGGRDNPNIRVAPMIVSGRNALASDRAEPPFATVDVVAVALDHFDISTSAIPALVGSAEGWVKTP